MTVSKTAGKVDIKVDAGSSFDILVPLWHMYKKEGLKYSNGFPWFKRSIFDKCPFTDDELENATVGFCVKEEPWTADDRDSLILTEPEIYVERNPITGGVRSAGIHIHLSHTDLKIEPGKYYYSLDIMWSDDKVDKVQKGRFIVKSNTLRSM